jgi:hypothetical protein
MILADVPLKRAGKVREVTRKLVIDPRGRLTEAA